MIHRGTHSCERSCTVTLGNTEFDVNYRLEGKCYSDPGKTSGPPEDCYPPESEANIDSVTLVEVSNERGVFEPGPALKLILLAEINKLPLDEYLLESWAESGYE